MSQRLSLEISMLSSNLAGAQSKGSDRNNLKKSLTDVKNFLVQKPAVTKNEIATREALIQDYITGLVEYLRRVTKDPDSDLQAVTLYVHSAITALHKDFEAKPKLYNKLITAHRKVLDQYTQRLSNGVSRQLFLELDIAAYDLDLINSASIIIARAANHNSQFSGEIINRILSPSITQDERALLFEDLVYMMKQAYDKGDYILTAAFLTAFSNAAINKLIETKKYLSQEAQKILTKIEDAFGLINKKRNILYGTFVPLTMISLDYIPKQLDNVLAQLNGFESSKATYENEGKQALEGYKEVLSSIAGLHAKRDALLSGIYEMQKSILIQILDEKIRKQKRDITGLELLLSQNVEPAKNQLNRLQKEKLRLLTGKINIQEELRENKFLFNDSQRSQHFYSQLTAIEEAIVSMQAKMTKDQKKIVHYSNQLLKLALQYIEIKKQEVNFKISINDVRQPQYFYNQLTAVEKEILSLQKKSEKLQDSDIANFSSELSFALSSLVSLKNLEEKSEIVLHQSSNLYQQSIQFLSERDNSADFQSAQDIGRAVNVYPSITQSMNLISNSNIKFSREVEIQFELIEITREVERKNIEGVLEALNALEKYRDEHEGEKEEKANAILQKLAGLKNFVTCYANQGFYPELMESFSLIKNEITKHNSGRVGYINKIKSSFKIQSSFLVILQNLQKELQVLLDLSAKSEKLKSERQSILAQRKVSLAQEMTDLRKLNQSNDKNGKEEVVPEVTQTTQVQAIKAVVQEAKSTNQIETGKDIPIQVEEKVVTPVVTPVITPKVARSNQVEPKPEPSVSVVVPSDTTTTPTLFRKMSEKRFSQPPLGQMKSQMERIRSEDNPRSKRLSDGPVGPAVSERGWVNSLREKYEQRCRDSIESPQAKGAKASQNPASSGLTNMQHLLGVFSPKESTNGSTNGSELGRSKSEATTLPGRRLSRTNG